MKNTRMRQRIYNSHSYRTAVLTDRKVEKMVKEHILVINNRTRLCKAYNIETGKVIDILPRDVTAALELNPRKFDVYTCTVSYTELLKELRVSIGGFTCTAPYNLALVISGLIGFHSTLIQNENPLLLKGSAAIICPFERELSNEEIHNILSLSGLFSDLEIPGYIEKETKAVA